MSLLLFGCANPIAGSPPQKQDKNSKISAMEAGPPEKDCMGLTAEKVQSMCGSGALKQKINLISDGYECEYSALDPQGADKPMLGTELKLAYFNGQDSMDDLKDLTKQSNKNARIGDIKNGFYVATGHWPEPERKIWSFDFYRQIGALTTVMYGTDIDYAPMDLSQDLGCSFGEMWNVLSDISHEDLSQERIDASSQISKDIAPLAATQAGPNNTPNCCTIMIVGIEGEADIKHDGKVSSAKKGQILDIGDEIYTGDNSHVFVAFFNCDFGTEFEGGITQIQSDSMGKIITTDDGKPGIFFDPGVAHVSVKRLEQFETDFQVSTPRLTCSVRG